MRALVPEGVGRESLDTGGSGEREVSYRRGRSEIPVRVGLTRVRVKPNPRVTPRVKG